MRATLPGFCLCLLACQAAPHAVPSPVTPGWGPSPSVAAAPPLMVPVAGVAPEQVPDTFAAPRDGGRLHQASDILAPEGTPVLSADDGTIVRIGMTRVGGKIIYATDQAGRYLYYYAHLSRFADELHSGQAVRRGEVLGYVGQTGNAAGTAPHLHFQLMYRPPGPSLNGQPIDPRPCFREPGRLFGSLATGRAVW